MDSRRSWKGLEESRPCGDNGLTLFCCILADENPRWGGTCFRCVAPPFFFVRGTVWFKPDVPRVREVAGWAAGEEKKTVVSLFRLTRSAYLPGCAGSGTCRLLRRYAISERI